jgi:hypothetical protein
MKDKAKSDRDCNHRIDQVEKFFSTAPLPVPGIDHDNSDLGNEERA